MTSVLYEKTDRIARLTLNRPDGITLHSPEGLNFKARAEAVGSKQVVEERDAGSFDWSRNNQIPGNRD